MDLKEKRGKEKFYKPSEYKVDCWSESVALTIHTKAKIDDPYFKFRITGLTGLFPKT